MQLFYRVALPARLGLLLATGVLLSGGPVAAAKSDCQPIRVVHLDIGHSPNRPGATSARGQSEYSFNARFARELNEILKAGGLRVRVINADARDISLNARADLIRSLKSGALLSIHHDSVQKRYMKSWTHKGKRRQYSDRFSGFSLFVSGRSPAFARSRALATSVGLHLLKADFAPSFHHAEAIKGESRPLLDARIGLHRYDGLAVLKSARIPAMLIEVGVIANRREEQKLGQREIRADFANALRRAIRGYCRR